MASLKPSSNQTFKLASYHTTKLLSNRTFKLSSYEAIKAQSLIAHTKLTAHIEDRMASKKSHEGFGFRNSTRCFLQVANSLEKHWKYTKFMPKRRPAETLVSAMAKLKCRKTHIYVKYIDPKKWFPLRGAKKLIINCKQRARKSA